MGPVEDAQAGFAELAALDPDYTEDGAVAPSVWELTYANAIEHCLQHFDRSASTR